ncbi:MAG: histidine phosphatase family protein [Bacteroidota bacterium]
MVKNLYLVRHAIAENTSGVDFDRRLTAEGERLARHLGRWLDEHKIEMDKVYTSPAARALTTADLITEPRGMSGMVEEVEELYEASVRTFLQTVNRVSESLSHVFFVGHNPTITYLAEFISGNGVDNMEPGSMVHLKIERLEWAHLGEKSGEFVKYLSPGEIS